MQIIASSIKNIENSMKSWNALQAEAMQTISAIQNIVSKIKHISQKNTLGKLDSFERIVENTTYKLYLAINEYIPKLRKYLKEFKKIMNEFRSVKNRLTDFQVSIHSIFERGENIKENANELVTLLDGLTEHVAEIVNMYENECLVKETIISELEKMTPPQSVLTAYLIVFSTEPYLLTERIEELREKLREQETRIDLLSISKL